MRLQHLKIFGFKSFAERSELAFEHGVTAIVGPNGCGKSNVIDAITWVLGEQSAKSLRGDRMEDVIFSGSDARKPTAAAEVRLHLAQVTASVPGARDNGHGNGRGSQRSPHVPAAPEPDDLDLDQPPIITRDVEVGRRLYRSGESEYLIDGEVCRLRDVQDLMMDSGVGIKAYAVIEQDKIGQILSARPIDRRQLLEEAAGVTKYKARRRAAELKLEAARQNLTRIDDIVFEVEKQRHALKRQAAKARRYRRLREDLRGWEKVLFARRYRMLAQAIQVAEEQLVEAQTREQTAAAQVAEDESHHGLVRIKLAEAESRAAATREATHARELEVGRRQQQIEFDRQQVTALSTSCPDLEAELDRQRARRGPAHVELENQRTAAKDCDRARDHATQALVDEEAAYGAAHRAINGLEGDVEAARSEGFAAINASTALRHAVESAAAGGNRLAAELAKLEAEASDLRIEAENVASDRETARDASRRGQEVLEATRVARAAREAELASARIERDWRSREVRAREHELAAMVARLTSLEELDATRAGYADAARLVLAESNDRVQHLGSVADYLEVDRRVERAVEACLGDVLQHVLVKRYQQAAEGLRLVREHSAGRCGFLVIEGNGQARTDPAPGDTALVPVSAVVRISGPYASAIEQAIGPAWVAESFEHAAAASRVMTGPVATLAGEVFRGPLLVQGGGQQQARGILSTKREIRELKERIAVAQADVQRLGEEIASLDATTAHAEAALVGLQTEQHEQEKVILGTELQLARVVEESQRIGRKQDLIETERRRAEEEKKGLDCRQAEAHESIARLETEQRAADERFTLAQRRLLDAREAIELQGRRTAEAKATLAALAERSAALAADVRRLEEAARELEARIAARTDEFDRTTHRLGALEAAIRESERLLDTDMRSFESLREEVRSSDRTLSDLRSSFEDQEGRARQARRTLDEQRAIVSRLDVARATSAADLSNLARSCVGAFEMSADQVVAEVERLEREGAITPEAGVRGRGSEELEAEENVGDDPEDLGEPEMAGPVSSASDQTDPQQLGATVSAEDVIVRLRAKIDRLGPVNMMAIDQFDELETRYTFLTIQRTDLVESILATGEAIKRIDQTTRERFREAFTAVNEHFQDTFATLFGGGRAGLVLLDEADLLESGIDIIAQPPGKRLQSVQLLSGGEKALSAMALMFAIFKYKPSPFCLLDEIDAPLDDANISRFLEMLRGMQTHTQFILVTHNRKTMEIADRLYGVTMEEPGVSKLISVKLN